MKPKQVGLFEAKTKLSEICAEVARSGEPVLVLRHGKPLVVISAVVEEKPSLKQRIERYRREHPDEKPEEQDFEVPERDRQVRDFEL